MEIKGIHTKRGTIISVINDGKHISPAVRDKLFDKGFSTKNEGKGLGLTIVKKIIRAHDWDIQLKSTSQTTFQIFIPATDI
ncbi:MAG: ATP-binding protein [Candidatus Hodarchaeales archaeon]